MREKKEFIDTSLDNLIMAANLYLWAKPGWEPIQLTYGSKKGKHILAFTAVDKNNGQTWQFFMTKEFKKISGVKDVGIYWVDDDYWYVGVPNP